MKLIVLNLPRDFEEQSLALLFKKIGDIKSCDLVIDKITGISKGFGFVEMALAHDGENAINKLHGTKIGENKIRVKASTQI
ncbi:RNA-binding protein [Hyphomicrobiales bacterium]|jgi:RNA recognition motif-containing protein|nr:RNA-binding protein [Hyphomicrobiales bacterium]MDA9034871.1 RNA-binding protein [Hyphomicrobiales bacterium]|tara:strand:- start:110 stop:352 length:243 start_codon:yes stop_codon:yes gene_type:complete